MDGRHKINRYEADQMTRHHHELAAEND
jgi:hypothetical protein